MKQSGNKQTFETGAQRDSQEGKGRPSLLTESMVRRVGVHLAEGAKHYGDHNWRAGFPFSRVIDSLIRHAFQYSSGADDEDHLAAIICNAMFLMEFEETHPELDDRYRTPGKKSGGTLTSRSDGARLDMKMGMVTCVDCGAWIPDTGHARCLSCMTGAVR